MLEFLDPGRDLAEALSAHYDLLLVVLSYLIASLAAYTGLSLADRVAPSGRCSARTRIWRISPMSPPMTSRLHSALWRVWRPGLPRILATG